MAERTRDVVYNIMRCRDEYVNIACAVVFDCMLVEVRKVREISWRYAVCNLWIIIDILFMIWPDVLFAGQLCETNRCVEHEGGMSRSFVGEFKSKKELCGQECKLGARCRNFPTDLVIDLS